MHAPHNTRETWDRLALLIIARPLEGWEDTFAEITRREIERRLPLSRQEERPAASPSERGENDGTKTKEDSAYGCSIPG